MNQQYQTLLSKTSTLAQKMQAIRAINQFMHNEHARLVQAMPLQQTRT